MTDLHIQPLEIAKEKAGRFAADFVQEDMLVGLGTGSTAAYFIARLSERCRQGLKIHAVATSTRSMQQALACGIPMVDIGAITTLDLTVDGADEVDSHKRMIKGGGGALLREKIVASMSRELVVIVDESKVVTRLGECPLPVEIIPFGYRATLYKLEQLGYTGTLRTSERQLFLTDNSNLIYDVRFPQGCRDPERDHERIRSIPGVIDTGFFFNMAGRVVVGFKDGRVEVHS